MEPLRLLLENAARDIEPQVRSQLGGFFGGMVRAYLPQTWVFRTESEVASLTVGRDGAVRVGDGPAENPDVTVEATHERLFAALRTRSRANVPPGEFKVTAHTSKGRTAFDYLRGRLGL
jgi:hypothetical protein